MSKQIHHLRHSPTRHPAPLERLYAREYPIIVSVLTRLAEQIPRHDAEVTLLALFGSVARISPHADSDTDLIVLLDPSDALELDRRMSELSTLVSRTIRRVIFREGHSRPEWGVTTITGNADASDLDPDLLAVIGREGVLLYRREDATLPAELERLMPFEMWKEQVRALLDQQRARHDHVESRAHAARLPAIERRSGEE